MFDTLLLAIGSTGPLRAFADSDIVGQLIVIIQIVMSICSWGMMLSKKAKLDDVRARSARFVDSFVKKNDPLEIFVEFAHPPHSLTEAPMGQVYVKSCERLASLVPMEQRQRMSLDPTYRLSLNRKQMDLVESVCAHTVEEECVKLSGPAMTWIAIFTTSAPLMGLFGTVWGVMFAFQAMAACGSADIAELAPGISSALLTTVVGLVVAIPSTIGYNLLQGRLESESVDLEGFGEDLLGKLRLHYLEER
jgi:biopolymer transport protein ExbB/TolQ